MSEEKNKEVPQVIIDIIVDALGISAEEVKFDSSLEDDLGADSVDQVEIIVSFEDEYDVNIPDSESEKLKTVGDIVNKLNEYKDAK